MENSFVRHVPNREERIVAEYKTAIMNQFSKGGLGEAGSIVFWNQLWHQISCKLNENEKSLFEKAIDSLEKDDGYVTILQGGHLRLTDKGYDSFP